MTHARGSCGIAVAPCGDCEAVPMSDDPEQLRAQIKHLAEKYVHMLTSRDAFMAQAAKLAVRCNDLQAAVDTRDADIRALTAVAASREDVRQEAVTEAQRLTDQVEAMRAECHELQTRVWELEGEGD